MMTKRIICNIEADELIYWAAHSCQKTGYIFTSKSGNTRDLDNKYTLTKIKQFMSASGKVLNKDYSLEKYVTLEPLEHCLGRLKKKISYLSQFGKPCLWIGPSDGSNFRNKVAKTPGPKGVGYKAGRPEKPVYIKEAREYLINKYGAKEAFGYEADDMLGIHQTKNTIAVHRDKDISMIPGEHINWYTGEHYTVVDGLGTIELITKTKINKHGKKVTTNKIVGRGRKFFYFQLLKGDSDDNIPGLPGIGDKTAYTILADATTDKECVELVNYYYHLKLGDSCNVIHRLQEVADLLWIVQDPSETGRDIILRYI